MKRNWQAKLILALVVAGLTSVLIRVESGEPGTSGFLTNVSQMVGDVSNNQPMVVPGVLAVKIKSRTVAQSLSKASTMTGLSSLDVKLSKFSAISVKKMFRHKPIPPNSGIPDISRILRVRIPEHQSPVMVARELARDPNVEYAEPIYVRYPCVVPNDSLYSEQHHLPQIYAPEAWDIQKGDSTVLIAIVDTGTDYEHEDLQANVWTNELEANGITGVDDDSNGFVDDIHGWDFGDDDPDPNPHWHGTFVAGVACAVTNNGIGGAGVSWNRKFMPIKALSDDRTLFRGFEAIIYAADNGADVINNSWGGNIYSKWEQEVINYAYSKGAIIVCAVGHDDSEIRLYPACYQHAIAVASVSVNDTKTSYSAFGPWIDICAPGGDQSANIWSTFPDDHYYYSRGNSFACPVVAGVCGLVKSLHPDWTNDQIVKQVLLTADNIDLLNPEYINKLGHGRVNAFRALTETDLTEPDARLAVLFYMISDSLTGNDDRVNDLLYKYWDIEMLGFPQSKTLANFPIVILSCSSIGVRNLSTDERNIIGSYLDAGGNLFISGQDIAWWLSEMEGTQESKEFLRDYLHAEYIANNSEDYNVTGVTGDPISHGMSFHIRYYRTPDVIKPTEGAATVFTYRNGGTGAVKYAGDHKVFYLGFGFEAVDAYDYTAIGDTSSIRTELLLRILNWLFIEHEPLKDTEDVESPGTIKARIIGDISDIQSVTLFWRLQGEEDFTSTQMIESEAGKYTANIPAPEVPSTIEYYIQMKNSYYIR